MTQGDPRIGTDLAGYRIESLLGRGGMSVVYLAEDPRLKRRAALKVLASELSQDEAFRQRFIGESELAASLDHPNVIPIFEAGEADGVLYIAMRYVKSTDLKALLRREGTLGVSRALEILAQAASALDAAAALGLVHRDVKPGNILVAEGQGTKGGDHVYLSDFGLSKHADSRGGLTRTGEFVGTVDYVAPEQIEGKSLDGRTDEYGLACVLYQCLTGGTPFPKDAETAVLIAHLMEDPPALSNLRPDLPATLDAVIAKGMSKKREDRYPDCSSFIADAARLASGYPPAPLPVAKPSTRVVPADAPSRVTGRAAWRSARVRVAAGIVAALILAGVVLAIAFGSNGPSRQAVSATDKFADPRSGWTQRSTPQSTVAYTDGHYAMRITALPRGRHEVGFAVGDWTKKGLESLSDVSIEVDVTKGPGGGPDLYGPACHFESGTHAYYLLIGPDGRYFFERGTTLLKKDTSSAINEGRKTNHVEAICRDESNGSVSLTLVVNGDRVGSFVDATAPIRSGRVGLAATGPVGLSVQFDNILVRGT